MSLSRLFFCLFGVRGSKYKIMLILDIGEWEPDKISSLIPKGY